MQSFEPGQVVTYNPMTGWPEMRPEGRHEFLLSRAKSIECLVLTGEYLAETTHAVVDVNGKPRDFLRR